MMNSLHRFLTGSTLAVAMLAAACGGNKGTEQTAQTGTQSAPQVITVDGSSTVFPITEAVAEEFQKANRGQRVTVGTSGTGGGFEKFCRNETDISDASRPMNRWARDGI